MALAQILPSLHPTTKFPEVKQIYKWFSCHWQGFSDKFTTQLCLQLISSCNHAPPWHGRGDLIVVWLSWHSKRRMTEGNYCTSPVLSREQTKLDDFCCFRGQWVTVSISREWLSHSQPCPLVLTRNKAQKTTNPRCSLQFNFLQAGDQLGENKGRVTFFTMKMANPSAKSLMWKSHSPTRTVQFCEKEGQESYRKRGKFSKLFLIPFSQSLAELSWSFWSHLYWEQSLWHIGFYMEAFKTIFKIWLYFLFFFCWSQYTYKHCTLLLNKAEGPEWAQSCKNCKAG